jgi:hypothetical protein
MPAFETLYGPRRGTAASAATDAVLTIAPPSGHAHSPDRLGENEPGSPQVDGHQAVPEVDRDLVQLRVGHRDAGVVVNRAKRAALGRRGEELLDVLLAAHVGTDEPGACADLGRRRPPRLLVDVREHDEPALLRERTGGRAADAGRGTRHNGDAPLGIVSQHALAVRVIK